MIIIGFGDESDQMHRPTCHRHIGQNNTVAIDQHMSKTSVDSRSTHLPTHCNISWKWEWILSSQRVYIYRAEIKWGLTLLWWIKNLGWSTGSGTSFAQWRRKVSDLGGNRTHDLWNRTPLLHQLIHKRQVRIKFQRNRHVSIRLDVHEGSEFFRMVGWERKCRVWGQRLFQWEYWDQYHLDRISVREPLKKAFPLNWSRHGHCWGRQSMRSLQPTENDSDLFHLENGAVARQRLYSMKSLNCDIKIIIVGPTPGTRNFFARE